MGGPGRDTGTQDRPGDEAHVSAARARSACSHKDAKASRPAASRAGPPRRPERRGGGRAGPARGTSHRPGPARHGASPPRRGPAAPRGWSPGTVLPSDHLSGGWTGQGGRGAGILPHRQSREPVPARRDRLRAGLPSSRPDRAAELTHLRIPACGRSPLACGPYCGRALPRELERSPRQRNGARFRQRCGNPVKRPHSAHGSWFRCGFAGCPAGRDQRAAREHVREW